jgi:hypothetical protein
MFGRGWNKTIVVSLSLAAAGVITCIAALLDSVAPTESVGSFLVVKCALGAVIIVVMISFAWMCDKCENYFSERIDRLLDTKKNTFRGAAKQVEKDNSVRHEADFHFSIYSFPRTSVSAGRYVGGLPGSEKL